MLLKDFDYNLPAELIAQEPLVERDTSKLLVLHRDSGDIEHRTFLDLIEYLHPGDLLVMNDTRVTAVRLNGFKPTGAKVEALLLQNLGGNRWEAMVKPGRRVDVGAKIIFEEHGLEASVKERLENGGRILDFGNQPGTEEMIAQLGEVPLPPYITHRLEDRARYQTVYASHPGSAAAPTAGFHFTPKVFAALKKKGVKTAFVTLHVGISTFRPVRTENIEEHVMHHERISLSPETAETINSTRGRVIAVGTTTVRVLESAAVGKHKVTPMTGETGIFITPGYEFQIVDAMVTNFHMPKSTLVILVSAFAGRDLIMKAYDEARKERYRFLSFGDAMLIL